MLLLHTYLPTHPLTYYNGSDYGVCGGRKDFLNTNSHEDKIVEYALWAFGFGGSYVHATLLHNWYFFLIMMSS
jgi:hypothetical protein